MQHLPGAELLCMCCCLCAEYMHVVCVGVQVVTLCQL
jgi:hypothetical protein